ncbi:MAG: hypothetical protein ACI9FJ_002797, partial [Alteromonadaceae bacterium]
APKQGLEAPMAKPKLRQSARTKSGDMALL